MHSKQLVLAWDREERPLPKAQSKHGLNSSSMTQLTMRDSLLCQPLNRLHVAKVMKLFMTMCYGQN